jgi:hypothetical protein
VKVRERGKLLDGRCSRGDGRKKESMEKHRAQSSRDCVVLKRQDYNKVGREGLRGGMSKKA